MKASILYFILAFFFIGNAHAVSNRYTAGIKLSLLENRIKESLNTGDFDVVGMDNFEGFEKIERLKSGDKHIFVTVRLSMTMKRRFGFSIGSGFWRIAWWQDYRAKYHAPVTVKLKVSDDGILHCYLWSIGYVNLDCAHVFGRIKEEIGHVYILGTVAMMNAARLEPQITEIDISNAFDVPVVADRSIRGRVIPTELYIENGEKWNWFKIDSIDDVVDIITSKKLFVDCTINYIKPDLEVVNCSPQYYSLENTGDIAQYTAVIRNRNEVDARYNILCELVHSGMPAAEQVIGKCYIPILNANDSKVITIDANARAVRDGGFVNTIDYVKLVVDPPRSDASCGYIVESDETNNEKAVMMAGIKLLRNLKVNYSNSSYELTVSSLSDEIKKIEYSDDHYWEKWKLIVTDVPIGFENIVWGNPQARFSYPESNPTAIINSYNFPVIANGWSTLGFSAPNAIAYAASDTHYASFMVAGGINMSGVLETHSRVGYLPGPKKVYNTWAELQPMPNGISEAGGVVLNGQTYVIGGRDGSGNISNAVRRSGDIETGWITLASMPTARSGMAVIKNNGIIYAIGGFDAAGDALDIVEIYDPVANTWVAIDQLEHARGGCSACVVNGEMLVLGGKDAYSGSASYISQTEKFNTLTSKWEVSSSLLLGDERSWAGVGVANDKVYLIGGEKNGTYLSSVSEFDPASSLNKWRRCSGMPTARAGASICAVGQEIYVVGGFNGGYLRLIEKYNPNDDVAPVPVYTLNMEYNPSADEFRYLDGNTYKPFNGGTPVVVPTSAMTGYIAGETYYFTLYSFEQSSYTDQTFSNFENLNWDDEMLPVRSISLRHGMRFVPKPANPVVNYTATDKSVTLTWNYDTVPVRVDRYEIELYGGSDFTNKLRTIHCDGSIGEYVINDLYPLRSYQIAVKAINSNAEPGSTAISVVTETISPLVYVNEYPDHRIDEDHPDYDPNYTPGEDEHPLILVKWTKTVRESHGDQVGYRIFISTNLDFTNSQITDCWIAGANSDIFNTRELVFDPAILFPGTHDFFNKTYYFKVLSFWDQDGNGVSSNELSRNLEFGGNISSYDYYKATDEGELVRSEIWKHPSGELTIDGNVIIPPGKSVIIAPGMTIKFSQGAGITCYGNLLAIGTKEGGDIKFTSESVKEPGAWKGIRLYNNAVDANGRSSGYDSKRFNNCKFEYAEYGIESYADSCEIRKCVYSNIMYENLLFHSGMNSVSNCDFALGNSEYNYVLQNSGHCEIFNCLFQAKRVASSNELFSMVRLSGASGRIYSNTFTGYNHYSLKRSGSGLRIDGAKLAAGIWIYDNNFSAFEYNAIMIYNSDNIAIFKNIISASNEGIQTDLSDILIFNNTITGDWSGGEPGWEYKYGIDVYPFTRVELYNNIIGFFADGFGVIDHSRNNHNVYNNCFYNLGTETRSNNGYEYNVPLGLRDYWCNTYSLSIDELYPGNGNIGGWIDDQFVFHPGIGPGFDYNNFITKGFFTLSNESVCRNAGPVIIGNGLSLQDLNRDGVITKSEYFTFASMFGYENSYLNIGAVQQNIQILGASPITLEILDPNNKKLTKSINEIGDDAIYTEVRHSFGKKTYVNIGSNNAVNGIYTIKVFSDSTALPFDVYSLSFGIAGKKQLLASTEPVPEPGIYHTYTFNNNDYIEPNAPFGVKLTMRKNGVALTWEQDKSDEDVIGYNIYKNSHRDFPANPDFQIGYSVTNTFVDPKVDFTRCNFYKIRAVDKSLNISEHSPVIGYDNAAQDQTVIDDFEDVSDWNEIWGYNVGSPGSGQIAMVVDTNRIEADYSMAVHYVFDCDTLRENLRIKKELPAVTDFSGMNTLGFWLHGDGNSAGLQIAFGNGNGNYSWRRSGAKGAIIDWTGWKRFDVPLSAFEAGWPQAPEKGWSVIEWVSITLRDDSYGACGKDVNIDSYVYFDEMQLYYKPEFVLVDNFENNDDWQNSYTDPANLSYEVCDDIAIVGEHSMKINYAFTDDQNAENLKFQKTFAEPLVLSSYEKIGFWLYGDNMNAGMQVSVGNGTGSYTWKVTGGKGTLIDFDGWQRFEIPFSEFQNGWPDAPQDGWSGIEYIKINIRDASYGGCGTDNNFASVIYLDDIVVYEGDYPLPTNTPPEVPTELLATETADGVQLTWSASANTEGDLAGYRVYRSYSPEAGYVLQSDVMDNVAYIDQDITEGVRYYYAVTAFDGDGNESEYSDNASALIHITLEDFEDVSDWSIPGWYDQTLFQIEGSDDQVQVGTYSGKLTYNFVDTTAPEGCRYEKYFTNTLNLSGYTAVSFWVYGDGIGAGLQVKLGNSSGYWIWRNTAANGTIVDFNGWQQFVVDLSEFQTGYPDAPPEGWQSIDYIQIVLRDDSYGALGSHQNASSAIYVDEVIALDATTYPMAKPTRNPVVAPVDLEPDMDRLVVITPNPFRVSAAINYVVPTSSVSDMAMATSLTVYDGQGRYVNTLVDERALPGSYAISWDSMDWMGHRVNAGIYIYELKVNGEVKETGQLMLVK